MKEMLRYGLVLGLICLVASALLAGVNHLTKDKILAQARTIEEAVLYELVSEAKRFEAVKSEAGEEARYYKAYDANDKFIAVVFKAKAKGYSGEIETMAGMKKSGEIIAIKVINQNETPGLGARVTEPEFSARFCGKDSQALAGVEAITGATISSRAVIESVKNKAQEISELIKNAR